LPRDAGRRHCHSLLLLFICWELVGLTSYLLIGFWYHKPSAAAAAKKAFITTRIGDLALLLGMVWLYSQSGTLLFYEDGGKGCLEHSTLARLVAQTTTAAWLSRPVSRYSSSVERSANRVRFRCMYGCPTPWKGLRLSAR